MNKIFLELIGQSKSCFSIIEKILRLMGIVVLFLSSTLHAEMSFDETLLIATAKVSDLNRLTTPWELEKNSKDKKLKVIGLDPRVNKKVIEQYGCDDVCPAQGRVYLAYKGVEKGKECDELGGVHTGGFWGAWACSPKLIHINVYMKYRGEKYLDIPFLSKEELTIHIPRIGVQRSKDVPIMDIDYIETVDGKRLKHFKQALEPSSKLWEQYRTQTTQLIAELSNNDRKVSWNAYKVLRGLGQTAVPALCKSLQKDNIRSQIKSLEILRQNIPSSKECSLALVELLYPRYVSSPNDKSRLRRKASDILEKMGPDALPGLLAAIDSKNPNVRRNAIKLISYTGAEAPKAVPDLIKALTDEDWHVRSSAARTLDLITRKGAPTEESLPALREALNDKEVWVRKQAAGAIVSILATQDSSFESCLREKHPELRRAVVERLGYPQYHKKELIPFLIQALKDEDESLRIQAAISIAGYGAEAKEAIPALIELLREENYEVHSEADTALSKVGPIAVPALLETVKSKNPKVRSRALGTLCKIDSPDPNIISEIKTALYDSNQDVQSAAIGCLHRLRKIDKQTISLLIDKFRINDNQLRNTVTEALVARQKIAVPQLLAAVESLNDDIRGWSTFTLGEIFAPSEDSPSVKLPAQLIPLLVDELKEKDRKRVTAVALGKVLAFCTGPSKAPENKTPPEISQASACSGVPSAVTALINAYNDTSSVVRFAVIEALGRVSYENAELWEKAVTVVVKSHGDRHQDVQQVARKSLAKIRHAPGDKPFAIFPGSSRESLDKMTELLIKLLSSKDGRTALLAIFLLGEMGRLAPPQAISPLTEKVMSPLVDTSWEAIKALENIGSLPDKTASIIKQRKSQWLQTIPFFMEKLQNEKERQPRLNSLYALSQFGSASRQALPLLRTIAANDPDMQIRQFSKQVINTIEKSPPQPLESEETQSKPPWILLAAIMIFLILALVYLKTRKGSKNS